MNKCKVTNKSGMSQLIIKSQKGQQISAHELCGINENKVKGLLHLEVVSKGGNFKLVYNITGFITFKEFLKAPLDKQTFAQVLQNIFENLQSVENACFNQQNLLMDFNHVMVNPTTKRIYFIYVPIQFFENGTKLRDFLLDIIHNCMFEPGEDTSYVPEYIKILNKGTNFSVFDLEEYINQLLGQETAKLQGIQCPQCGVSVEKGTNYCSACGAKVSGNGGSSKKGIYDPIGGGASGGGNNVQEVDPGEPHKVKENTENLSTATTVLGGVTGGTTVLGTENFDAPTYPVLVRKRYGDRIQVDKPVFRIGKEKQYCDYFISDNSHVSRSHADIITREETKTSYAVKRYFVIDLNSTNRTYVDDKAIPVNQEIEILAGTRLRFADEEFEFLIE